MKFENWAGTYSCQPQGYFQPENEQELREILQTARQESRNIRVVGSGYSPSDLCCTKGFLISLKKMDRILRVDVEKKTVKVQAGMVLSKLVPKLKEYNLAMNILPSLTHFSVAGMISTATHNSGLKHGVTSTNVLEMDVMMADGSTATCSRQDNQDLFHGVVAGLGALAVILTVTFQCDELFALKVTQKSFEFGQILDEIQQISQNSEYSRIFYIPRVDKLIVQDVERVPTSDCKRNLHEKPTQKMVVWLEKELIGYRLFEFLMFLNVFLKEKLAALVSWLYFVLFYQKNYSWVDEYDKIFTVEVKIKQHASEWALPIENVKQALLQMKQLIDAEPSFPVHFPYEVRFVQKDDLWLSPAFGRDTAYINIIAFCPYGIEPQHEQYFAQFSKIMQDLGGRPHLAKDHSWTVREMAQSMPKFGNFQRLRDQVDPDRLFTNDYVKRVLGN